MKMKKNALVELTCFTNPLDLTMSICSALWIEEEGVGSMLISIWNSICSSF